MIDINKWWGFKMGKGFNKQLLFDNIAYLVKERGLKIGELEAEAGVSPGYISRASKESGSTPGIEFVVNIANELHMTVDALINTQISELTATEMYIVSFLQKLERDTNDDKLDWNRESAESLRRIEIDANGNSEHPLYRCETFYEESEMGYPEKITDCRFASHSFDVHTAPYGDCFNLRLKNNALLYLMNISKSVHRVGDPNARAKEVWLYQAESGSQYLCCNKDAAPIGKLVDSLYLAVSENNKHPKIKPDFQHIINAFMEDDLSDDEMDILF